VSGGGIGRVHFEILTARVQFSPKMTASRAFKGCKKPELCVFENGTRPTALDRVMTSDNRRFKALMVRIVSIQPMTGIPDNRSFKCKVQDDNPRKNVRELWVQENSFNTLLFDRVYHMFRTSRVVFYAIWNPRFLKKKKDTTKCDEVYLEICCSNTMIVKYARHEQVGTDFIDPVMGDWKKTKFDCISANITCIEALEPSSDNPAREMLQVHLQKVRQAARTMWPSGTPSIASLTAQAGSAAASDCVMNEGSAAAPDSSDRPTPEHALANVAEDQARNKKVPLVAAPKRMTEGAKKPVLALALDHLAVAKQLGETIFAGASASASTSSSSNAGVNPGASVGASSKREASASAGVNPGASANREAAPIRGAIANREAAPIRGAIANREAAPIRGASASREASEGAKSAGASSNRGSPPIRGASASAGVTRGASASDAGPSNCEPSPKSRGAAPKRMTEGAKKPVNHGTKRSSDGNGDTSERKRARASSKQEDVSQSQAAGTFRQHFDHILTLANVKYVNGENAGRVYVVLTDNKRELLRDLESGKHKVNWFQPGNTHVVNHEDHVQDIKPEDSDAEQEANGEKEGSTEIVTASCETACTYAQHLSKLWGVDTHVFRVRFSGCK